MGSDYEKAKLQAAAARRKQLQRIQKAEQDIATAQELAKAEKQKAAAAEEKAKKSMSFAMSLKGILERAKCKHNPGCSTLAGYCCPTLSNTDTGVELGGNLACCGAGIETDSLQATEETNAKFGAWLMSMAFAAVASAMITLRCRRKINQESSYRGMAA